MMRKFILQNKKMEDKLKTKKKNYMRNGLIIKIEKKGRNLFGKADFMSWKILDLY